MNDVFVKLVFSVLFLFVSSNSIYAWTGTEGREEYWDRADEFLLEQTRQAFTVIDEVLNSYPPSVDESLARRSALINLDAILHDTRLDDSPALYDFVATRIGRVAKALEQPLKKGMMIYKLYNHGFVVRTPSATVAFDLFRGGKDYDTPYTPDEIMQKIVDKCDIMFITHAHGDHADPKVIDMFTKAGKSVIVPANLWTDNTDPCIKHMRSEDVISEAFDFGTARNVKVNIFPGHQGPDLINNVYVVTFPEGYSVAHTGDQSNNDDLEWISKVKDQVKTDVLLVNCWTYPTAELVEGFAPDLVITGHENEMNHTIDHREPHWLNYDRWSDVNRDKIFMTWGECYLFK